MQLKGEPTLAMPAASETTIPVSVVIPAFIGARLL
jgi:hypothetical protein